jgi:hypothetical protein
MGYYGNVPKVGEKTRLTKDELVTMLNREIEFGGDRYAIQERRIAELQKRRTELQEANNRMLERARNAEDEAKTYADRAGERLVQLEAVQDELAELKGERERDIILHLEQQTWARIELNKANEAREFWVGEASKWATKFATQRQNLERYQAQMNIWVDGMKAFAKGGIVIDLIVCGLAFLVIAGVVPPVFR